MWHRLAGAAGLLVAAAGLSSAQPYTPASAQAAPPPKAALDRLNLRAEWALALPVDGARDAVTQVQTCDDQLFVQVRGGGLFAVDALTGRVQWSARLGDGVSGNTYPVAANADFVFAVYLTKLYAFYRYTGVVEFVTELGTPAVAGPAADDGGVYCVLGVRPGAAGAHRISVYDMTRPIPVGGPPRAGAAAPGQRVGDPVADLVGRYAPRPPAAADAPEVSLRPRVLDVPTGGVTGSRTPSLNALPSVTPPYALDNRSPAPSLNTVPSLRPPYHLRQESGKYIQATPSLGVIPPSVAASLQLSDLRPRPVSPPLRWEYGLTGPQNTPLLLTPTRVWAVTDDGTALALSKVTAGTRPETEATDRYAAAVAAPPVSAGTVLYLPLANGGFLAVEGAGGTQTGGTSVRWRADVGGLNNRPPFVSGNRVYAAGDVTGVVCLNRDNGDLLWRTDPSADRIVAATDKLAYVRDRRGRLLVYDAVRPTDADGKRSAPLAALDAAAFDVDAVNTASDRLYLASAGGLIVCLRDAGAAYAKPTRLWPPPQVNAVKGVVPAPKDGMSPDPKGEPQSEAEKAKQ